MFVFSPGRLHDVRVGRGLTREKLAVDAGSSYPAISLYEQGQRVPSRATLLRLAAALGVPASDLVEPDPDFEAAAP